MNRKDFEELSRIIRAMPLEQRLSVAQQFATALDGKHSGFDRKRFLKASGGEPDTEKPQ